MGQYFTPIIIRDGKNNSKTIQKFYSHNYDNGLKLTEHSYMGNNFVETVAMQLFKKPARLGWVGDYAHDEYLDDLRAEGKTELAEKLQEFTEIERIDDDSLYKNPKADLRKNCLDMYIYNHAKKEVVDCYNFFVQNSYYDGDWGICVHPLPLLTAIGNGYGGGDYGTSQPDADKIGCWAGDLIEISPWNKKYENYKDITKDLRWTDKYERPISVKEAVKRGSIIEYECNDPFEKDKVHTNTAIVLDLLSDAAMSITATIPFKSITKVWNLDETGVYKLNKIQK